MTAAGATGTNAPWAMLPRVSAHVLRGERSGARIRTYGGGLVDLKTNVRRPEMADLEILCGNFEFRARRRSALLDALPECLVVEFAQRPEFGWLQGLLRMMAHEMEHQGSGAAAIVSELSGAVFTLAIRAHLETQPTQVGVLGLMAQPRLAPALAAMLESPGEHWTVESLAAHCHLSRAAFARLFTQHARTSPLELLTSLRMELATRLLAKGGSDVVNLLSRPHRYGAARADEAGARHAAAAQPAVRASTVKDACRHCPQADRADARKRRLEAHRMSWNCESRRLNFTEDKWEKAMPEIHHDEHLLDRAAMLVMRAMLATQPTLHFAPEARPAFDELMKKTPAVECVTYEAGRVGDVPGWWCRPPQAMAGKVVLYFHGGAYALGSAQAYRHFVGQIASRARSAAFIVDFRLAPEHPFPAAVEDALAAYDGLAAAGFGSVAIAGDSAGGGLALVLLERVTHRSPRVGPMPAAAAVMSPWTDLALGGDSLEGRRQADPLLSRETLEEAALAYAGTRDRHDPRLSPLQGDLSGLPAVLLHVGQDEVLLDDSRRYQQRCEAAGSSASVHVWHGMTHVFPSSLAMLRAAHEALDLTGEFLHAALRDATRGRPVDRAAPDR